MPSEAVIYLALALTATAVAVGLAIVVLILRADARGAEDRILLAENRAKVSEAATAAAIDRANRFHRDWIALSERVREIVNGATQSGEVTELAPVSVPIVPTYVHVDDTDIDDLMREIRAHLDQDAS